MNLKSTLSSLTIFLLLIFFSGCGKEEISVDKHPLLGDLKEIVLHQSSKGNLNLPSAFPTQILKLENSQLPKDFESELIVDYPLNLSIFPIDFIAPTFLWHDDTAEVDTWFVKIEFDGDLANPISVLIPGAFRPEAILDLDAISNTNKIYKGTEYQQRSRAWKPSAELWKEIKHRSLGRNATLTFSGFTSSFPEKLLSRGKVQIITSKDPVNSPIFYRDVPLMPSKGKHGVISPISKIATSIIAWRLRDVSRPDSKLVLKGLPSCGNCHSFSKDGKTLGMDVDGPDGDKGMYGIKNVEKNMVINRKDTITWNSFPEKPEGHRTIGFLSRVSPDGSFVASTVNEKLYIKNFTNFKFLQVFFPTRGIIGIYSRKEKRFFKLKGADNPDYVHCSPVWSPDGKWVYFSRAKAFDPYREGMKEPEKANDPNEPKIQYDIYRVPFNEGKGGNPQAIEGASSNGFSNSFPKISPDNKWLVWTRARNALLMRPDSKLFIVNVNGGKPREMKCNTSLMNSWHSFSLNSRWLVFSSKSRTPYTQAFLTHIDENGNDSPAILIPNCTAANRAVNLPEFLNATYSDLDTIKIPAVQNYTHMIEAEKFLRKEDYAKAKEKFMEILKEDPSMTPALLNMGFVLNQEKNYEGSLIYNEEASRNSPSNISVLCNLYALYYRTGRLYMSQKTLRKLNELVPGLPGTQEGKIQIENSLKELEGEISKTEKYLKEKPEELGLYLYMAILYRQSGRLEDSVKMTEKAHSISQGDPHVMCNLAYILATNPDESIRDGKRAVKLAEKAISIMGSQGPEAFDVLAAAYAETGDFKKANEAITQAISISKKVNPSLIPDLKLRQFRLKNGRPVRTPRDR